MRKEILDLLNGTAKSRGIKWSEAIKTLSEQSSIKVDPVDFTEIIKGLESEGMLKVVGEKDKRMIRRIDA